MADNIVGSLFGVNPQQLAQANQATDVSRAYQFANLRPAEQAQYGAYLGGSQLGRAATGLMGGDAEMQKVTAIKQLSSRFDLTSAQGLRDFARALQPIAPQEAMMAAAKADEVEKSGLGLQKTRADITKAELSAANEEKLRAELSQLGPNPTDQQVIAVVQKYGSPDKILQILTASQDRAAARSARASAEGGPAGLGKLNTAEKAVDTKFGKEYAEYFAGGGINSLEKNVEELNRAIQIIEQSKEGDTSGKLIGLADKTGQLTFVSPLAADVKDIIGGVAQSNLRQVLGGQFAAKEGEALLQRAYDTGQTKENNLKRLRSLYKQASDTINDKKAAAQYYEQFGTLKGFKGTGSSDKKEETPPAKDKNQEALDWIKANPNDPRVPAIKKKLGIQ